GPFSRELYAGTHVGNSSQVGLLTVSSEGSVGSGARRIEALVGADAFDNLAAERSIVNEMSVALKSQPADLPGRVEKLMERLAEAERQLSGFRQLALAQAAATMVDHVRDVSGVR